MSITSQQVVDHYSLPVFKLPEPAHVKLDDIIQSEQEFICMGGIQEFKQARSKVITPRQIRDVHWLHKRMNHISRQSIVTCMRNGHWRGLPEGLTADIVDKVLNDQPCTACALGKRNKLNMQGGSHIRDR